MRGRRKASRHVLSHGWAIAVCATLIAVSVFTTAVPAAAESRIIRVGLYENAPKIFSATEEDGEPSGIFVDLLEYIADEEGWTLVWVPGTWDEGLAALEDGRIDLMPDVAYSAQRDTKYDFHETPVVDSWSYVYAAPGTTADRVSQLDGQRVAVLDGSIQETVFSQMVAGFGYDVEIVQTDSIHEAFQLASDGRVDAAIANYLFGDYFYRDYGLTKTPIVFNAVPLFYATAEGQNDDILDAIDQHLKEWIREPGSAYYVTLSRYTTKETVTKIPEWVFWGAGTAIGMLLLATAVIVLLRWQVQIGTQHLASTKETLRLAMEAAGEGIFDWYPKTGEIIWSPRSYTMLGFESDEFPVDIDSWAELIHPDDRERVVTKTLRRIGPDMRSFSVEYRLRTKSGDWLWTISRGKLVALDGEGNIERVIGTNTDVTERKTAEDELRQYREHLEEIVEARTLALKEVNAELRDATEAKSQFLAAMSHELRTPLNSIIGFSGLLHGGMVGPLTKEQALQTGMINTSGKQLLDLINNILDLSRIEAGVTEVHLGPVDLFELVADVAATLRPLVKEKGVAFRIDTLDQAMVIQSDGDKLRQILFNLVGNAVKFTMAGEISLRIEGDPDGRTRIIIADTGPGISAREIERIFDAFHQAGRVGGVPPNGTGLGLAISQDLAHLLGGEIAVASVEGEGSTFTLWLEAPALHE